VYFYNAVVTVASVDGNIANYFAVLSRRTGWKDSYRHV